MRTASLLAALGLSTAALVPTVWSRAVAAQESGGLIKVLPGAGAAQDDGLLAEEIEPEFDRRAWRERLLDPDLDAREANFDQLVLHARAAQEVRELLETWAQDDFELELAWTARLVLREAQRGPAPSLAPNLLDPWGATPFGAPGARDLQGLQERLRALEREIDQWFATPRGFGRLHGPGQDPFGMFRNLPLLPEADTFSGRSLRMQTGPDGVRVEVEVDEDGKTHTETYEAESLEQLLEQHPELKDRIGLGGERLDLSLPVPNWPDLAPGAAGGLRTDVLGVLMREPSADQVVAQGLEAGLGLEVQSVLAHSLAAELGVRAADVLVELEGRPLRSGTDVREALAARPAEEPLDLKVLRQGTFETLTWKP